MHAVVQHAADRPEMRRDRAGQRIGDGRVVDVDVAPGQRLQRHDGLRPGPHRRTRHQPVQQLDRPHERRDTEDLQQGAPSHELVSPLRQQHRSQQLGVPAQHDERRCARVERLSRHSTPEPGDGDSVERGEEPAVELARLLQPALPLRHHVGVHPDVDVLELPGKSGERLGRLLLGESGPHAVLAQVGDEVVHGTVHDRSGEVDPVRRRVGAYSLNGARPDQPVDYERTSTRTVHRCRLRGALGGGAAAPWRRESQAAGRAAARRAPCTASTPRPARWPAWR